MGPVEIALTLLRAAIEAVIAIVGKEKASELLSREAIVRANAVADAIEEARGLKTK